MSRSRNQMLVAVFLTLSYTSATVVPRAAVVSSASVTAETKEKALAVVVNVLKSSAGLKSSVNRIKLRARGLVVLGASHPDIANEVCAEVENDLVELYDGLPDNAGVGQRRSAELLRAESVKTIADVNPQLALGLLYKTAARIQTSSRDDAELKSYIATKFVDSDPKRAAELMQSVGAVPNPSLLVDSLRRLRLRNPDVATSVAQNFAEKFIREKLETKPEAFFAVIGMLDLDRPHTSNGDLGNNQSRLLSLDMRVALTRKMITAAATRNEDERRQQLTVLLPIVDEFLPAELENIRRELDFLTEKRESGKEGIESFWSRASDRPIAEVLPSISDQPREARSVLYQQAAMRAIASGDTRLASEICDTFIKSTDDRQEILSEIQTELIAHAAEKGDASQVSQLIQSAPVSERSKLALQAVNWLSNAGFKKDAFQLLQAMRQILSSEPRTLEEFNLRLQLANVYLRFDPTMTGNLLENAVIRLNGLLSSAAALDGYISDGPILTNGELDLSNTGTIMSLYQATILQLAPLARRDYARALELASEFQSPEAQMMAELAVADSVLASS